MRFVEHDIAGTLVHQVAELSGRYTMCGVDMKYYNYGATDDLTLAVTCLRCLVGDRYEPRALSSGARPKRSSTK